jgi:hypothetical protein
MPRQELVKELQIREKQLLEELNAIRVILGTSSSDVSNDNGQPDKVIISGTPKGKMSWENYVELMLKEIGGKGKSQDVAKAVCKANPKIDEARVLHAVRHHLSKLLKFERIGATKNEVQSEGYTFFIKQ